MKRQEAALCVDGNLDMLYETCVVPLLEVTHGKEVGVPWCPNPFALLLAGPFWRCRAEALGGYVPDIC